MLHRFGSNIINHIKFLHVVTKPSDYEQTVNSDIMLRCPRLPNRDFNIFLKSKDTVGTPKCLEDMCINGECKTIPDTTQGFCKCNKMFHGPTCDDNIQNIIDYAAIESEINGVIYQPVPDLNISEYILVSRN